MRIHVRALLLLVLFTNIHAFAATSSDLVQTSTPFFMLPQVFYNFNAFTQQFFDEADNGFFNVLPSPQPPTYLNGWASQFGPSGILAGGTNFSTNLFTLNSSNIASVNWNLTATPYRMTYLDVFGRDSNGTGLDVGFLVPLTLDLSGSNLIDSGTVAMPAGFSIIGISFLGVDLNQPRPLSEPSTLAMLLPWLLLILFVQSKYAGAWSRS